MLSIPLLLLLLRTLSIVLITGMDFSFRFSSLAVALREICWVLFVLMFSLPTSHTPATFLVGLRHDARCPGGSPNSVA